MWAWFVSHDEKRQERKRGNHVDFHCYLSMRNKGNESNGPRPRTKLKWYSLATKWWGFDATTYHSRQCGTITKEIRRPWSVQLTKNQKGYVIKRELESFFSLRMRGKSFQVKNYERKNIGYRRKKKGKSTTTKHGSCTSSVLFLQVQRCKRLHNIHYLPHSFDADEYFAHLFVANFRNVERKPSP